MESLYWRMLVKGMGFCNYLLVRISRFMPTLRAMVEPGFVVETTAPRSRSTQ